MKTQIEGIIEQAYLLDLEQDLKKEVDEKWRAFIKLRHHMLRGVGLDIVEVRIKTKQKVVTVELIVPKGMLQYNELGGAWIHLNWEKVKIYWNGNDIVINQAWGGAVA